MVRRAITAYFGLVSFLDDNIGKILRAVEGAGLGTNTRILYSSDHGDNLGTRGMWGKSTMRGVRRYTHDHGRARRAARQLVSDAGDARGRFPDFHPGTRRAAGSA
jgi:hypothetical protein